LIIQFQHSEILHLSQLFHPSSSLSMCYEHYELNNRSIRTVASNSYVGVFPWARMLTTSHSLPKLNNLRDLVKMHHS
jgi:hypothetical protein